VGLGLLGGFVRQHQGSVVADCSLGFQREEGMQWARGWALVGASFGSEEQVNVSIEFREQHIDCVQHLCLQCKGGVKTQQLSVLIMRVVAVIIGAIDQLQVLKKKILEFMGGHKNCRVHDCHVIW